MPCREIFYRVLIKIHQKIDKQRFKTDCIAPESDLSNGFSNVFRLSQHIERNALSSLQSNLDGDVMAFVNDAYNNRFDVFGVKCDFGEKIDWHRDPNTDKCWPIEFWGDVDIRDGVIVGGPKFVWEINRLYCLPVLGLGYRFTGETKYVYKVFDILQDWLQNNLYPMGVNWTSGIELGIRIANLIWALSYLDGYNFSKRDFQILNNFIYFHGTHLHRYPSKYSSNNNHSLAEGLGLFLAGCYFPHLPDSKKWFHLGKNLLEREVSRQILPDGGSLEFTTSYLSLVFDFFLLFKLVCDKNGIAYDRRVNERLEQACQYIHTLMDKNGHIPNIGDQDSAILVNFTLDSNENFQSILNTGAVLFGQSELKRENFPDFKTLVLLGDREDVCAATHSVFATTPKAKMTRGSRLFRESGLAVIRADVDGREILFIGNATPLGMPPLYAHGHLDALSFTLSVEGMEFLVDPGTYLYHSGGKWRRYFRSTAAHNTVRINEKDMSEQVGDFMFDRPYRIIKNCLNLVDDCVIWNAAHDAYTRMKPSVYHRRQVVFEKEKGAFNITDSLRSKGKYRAEQFFHFHPECNVTIEKHTVRIERDDVGLKLVISNFLEIQTFRGSENPLIGWYSKAFNHLQETTTIVCSSQIEGNAELDTVLDLVQG